MGEGNEMDTKKDKLNDGLLFLSRHAGSILVGLLRCMSQEVIPVYGSGKTRPGRTCENEPNHR